MRVSVVIPAFNAAATLAAAIESALSQRFDGDYEVIVVNDGSTDATADVLDRFGSRIKVINQENRGLSGARNSGVAIAQGEYLAFLDADDAWMPDKLAASLATFERHRMAVLVYSDTVLIDENGVEAAPSLVAPELARAPSMGDLLERWWPIIPSTVVVRRSTFEAVGGFVEEMRSYEDMDFWLRAREAGEFAYIPRPLATYRLSPVTERMIKYEQAYELFVKRTRERYGTAALALIRAVRHAHSSARGLSGLLAMRNGDMRSARHDFVRALRFEPLAPRTVLRLLRTFLPAPLARALTGRTRALEPGGKLAP